MNKKQFYSAPEAELLVIKFEGNFCQTTPTPTPGAAGADEAYDDLGEF